MHVVNHYRIGGGLQQQSIALLAFAQDLFGSLSFSQFPPNICIQFAFIEGNQRQIGKKLKNSNIFGLECLTTSDTGQSDDTMKPIAVP